MQIEGAVGRLNGQGDFARVDVAAAAAQKRVFAVRQAQGGRFQHVRIDERLHQRVRVDHEHHNVGRLAGHVVRLDHAQKKVRVLRKIGGGNVRAVQKTDGQDGIEMRPLPVLRGQGSRFAADEDAEALAVVHGGGAVGEEEVVVQKQRIDLLDVGVFNVQNRVQLFAGLIHRQRVLHRGGVVHGAQKKVFVRGRIIVHQQHHARQVVAKRFQTGVQAAFAFAQRVPVQNPVAGGIEGNKQDAKDEKKRKVKNDDFRQRVPLESVLHFTSRQNPSLRSISFIQ